LHLVYNGFSNFNAKFNGWKSVFVIIFLGRNAINK